MSVLSRFAVAALFAGALAWPALAQDDSSKSGVGKGGDSSNSEPAETTSAPDNAQPLGDFGSNSGATDTDTHGLSGEGIANFDSDTTIGPDGTLHVRETITVNVTGDEIRHGIYRDFPTDYRDRHGIRRRTTFDVESVTRDGVAEPYEIDSISNGKEAKIGSADVIVTPGIHTYVVTYTTKRQIGFFENFDELYWNATGNGWKFTIAHAVATIHLPPAASVVQTAFYTGEQGESGKDATEQRIDDHTMRWETTRQLRPGEGLTAAVAFTKGIVAKPSGAEEARDYLMDNASSGVALIGLVVLSLYFGIAWYKFGRDPAHGTIVPLFAPPKDFSASAVRFVHRMGYDRKAFAAALIAMATKGYLTIKEESGVYTLKRTGKSENDAGLATAERAVAKPLFDGPDDEITLKQSNHTDVQASISGLQKALRNEDEGVYFISNRGWFAGGLAIVIVSAILAALLADNSEGATPVLFFVGGWSIGTSFLVYRAYMSWQSINGPGWKIFNIAGALFASFFALIFVGGLLAAILSVGDLGLSALTILALAIQGILAFVFYRLLKAPTVAGQKVRDEIDGFKMFLEVTEKDRLEMLHPPKITPEVFEKFLPYAIALDCENQWSKKFEAEAAAAGIGGQQGGYTPVWYFGPSYSRLGTTGFVSAVGTAIGTAAASAATAPGSSSGSGGGGFSGGGGGGGGGGGW